MSNQGKIQLRLLDADGRPLDEGVNLRLEHLMLSEVRMVRGADASRTILIEDLHAVPWGAYRLEADPISYPPAGQLITVQPGGVTELEIRFHQQQLRRAVKASTRRV